jgi:chromate transport protein ChrA
VFAVLLVQSFETWESRPLVMGAIAGTVAAVVGMMWSSVLLLIRPHWGGVRKTLRALAIAGAAFLASWKFGVTPVPIILASCAVGYAWVDKDDKA